MTKIQIPASYLTQLTKAGQILELNQEVRCKLGVSKVHGVGVFSIRDIYKGNRCYITPRVTPRFYTLRCADFGKLFPEVRQLILDRWASVVNGSIFQSPNDDQSLLMFCNHSPDPNYDVVSDTALRDIAGGEEVLEDYCAMDNAQKVYPWLVCPNVKDV